MMSVVHLTQIRLLVSDFDGMFAFYRDVIGLTPMFDPPRRPYAAFQPELGSSLCLHERAALAEKVGALSPARPTGDQALVSLRVDDLAGYRAEVAERGGRLLGEPVDFDGRLVCGYLRDPEGNLLEIQQWLVTRAGTPVPSTR